MLGFSILLSHSLQQEHLEFFKSHLDAKTNFLIPFSFFGWFLSGPRAPTFLCLCNLLSIGITLQAPCNKQARLLKGKESFHTILYEGDRTIPSTTKWLEMLWDFICSKIYTPLQSPSLLLNMLLLLLCIDDVVHPSLCAIVNIPNSFNFRFPPTINEMNALLLVGTGEGFLCI